jgi:glycosyltransferase involved in cell wall biosynthesis
MLQYKRGRDHRGGKMTTPSARIGFVSTRLKGTDGVSLEVRKWAEVLTGLQHECFFFAGESDWPPERSYVVPEAHFTHPDVLQLSTDLFDDYIRTPETSQRIDALKIHLKSHLHRFIRQFALDLLIAENALAIPVHVPLGLALTEVIAETSLDTIGHHHDFAWERSRFSVSAAEDYLYAAFPATLRAIHHVVINSYAQSQLAYRRGISSTVVPNVMKYEEEPLPPDAYAADLRAALGLQPGEFFILQPTRIVPRKRIERAIGLAARLGLPYALVISHGAGDEGAEYAEYLQEIIASLGARVIFGAAHFGEQRGQAIDGRKLYALADAYQSADLVTYPSSVEGFGNAFLEAIYYRRPLVVSTYEIYRLDLKPKGFQVVEFDEYVRNQAVEQARELLLHPDRAAAMAEHNYAVARRYFSYSNLEKLLVALISQCRGD